MGKLNASTLATIVVLIFAGASSTVAQDASETRICPLPSTSEEILRRRLAITEYVELYKFAPLAAWAMRAGHDAVLDQWAKDRKGSANQAKTEFSLAPLTQWLALGRSSPLQEIREALADTVHAKARPVTGSHKYFKNGVLVEPPPVDHVDGAQRAAMSLVLASMLVHGRHAEAIEHFHLSEYPGERQWHIGFLVGAGALDQAIALYRRPPVTLIGMDGRRIALIAGALLRNGEIERLAAFLDAELVRIREHKGSWYWQEPILTELARLGRVDWEPPDPLPEKWPASMKVGAVASLIAALRSVGREGDAERYRKKVHEHLEKELAGRKERQAKGRPSDVGDMFVAPSPETFDAWIEIERAYGLLTKGDLETAEKIVLPLQGDRFARYSRSAALSNLAGYARRQGRWSKAEELLTIAIDEPLFPGQWVPGVWLAAAADAHEAGETDLAARWAKNAGTTFCRLDPDRLERFLGHPVGDKGDRKPLVLPFVDSLYVHTAVREGRLPAHARAR